AAVLSTREPERIRVAEVVFRQERQALPVFRPLHVIRMNVAKAARVRGVPRHALECRSHALDDEALERLARHRLERRLPDHVRSRHERRKTTINTRTSSPRHPTQPYLSCFCSASSLCRKAASSAASRFSAAAWASSFFFASSRCFASSSAMRGAPPSA